MKSKKLFLIGMFLLLLFPLVTSLQEPTLYNEKAKEINSNSVVLEGELLDLGSYTNLNISFKYREENIINWSKTEKINLDIETNFQKYVKDLKPSTSYQYKVIAEENNITLSESATRTFTTETKDNIFKMDFDKTSNVLILGLFLIIAGILFYFGFVALSSLMVVISGFILLFSGINFIIGVFVILIGFIIAFIERGNN